MALASSGVVGEKEGGRLAGFCSGWIPTKGPSGWSFLFLLTRADPGDGTGVSCKGETWACILLRWGRLHCRGRKPAAHRRAPADYRRLRFRALS